MKKTFAILIILFSITPVLALAAGVQGSVQGSATNPSTSQANCSMYDSRSVCYQQLSPITDPGTGKKVRTNDFPSYLQGIYRIGIGACFVLGVIMFTWAGIEYIITESMGGKSDAKQRITNALIGLTIALVSYILLQTINPDLLIFKSLDTTSTTQSTSKYYPVTPAGPTPGGAPIQNGVSEQATSKYTPATPAGPTPSGATQSTGIQESATR